MIFKRSSQMIYRGEDSAEAFLRAFLNECKKNIPVFLVTGRGSYHESGAARFFQRILSGRDQTHFFDFSANPKLSDLAKGLSLFNARKHECIIAVGGGSVLDMAKLVSYIGSNKLCLSDVIAGKKTDKTVPSRLLAVPMTAGTGSEATRFAVLYDGNIKYSIANDDMLPGHVWLNPRFTLSQSKYQAACSGMDAFVQAIESYWAVCATEESKEHSAKAIKLCLDNMVSSVTQPSVENRIAMMEAAYWSGKAINIAKTTAPHALSYSLTIHYGMPHGHAVALTLARLLCANAQVTQIDVSDVRGLSYVQNTMRDLFKLLRVGNENEGSDLIKNIMDEIGMERNWFQNRGINIDEVRGTMINEVNMERLQNNPRKIGKDVLQDIVGAVQ